MCICTCLCIYMYMYICIYRCICHVIGVYNKTLMVMPPESRVSWSPKRKERLTGCRKILPTIHISNVWEMANSTNHRHGKAFLRETQGISGLNLHLLWLRIEAYGIPNSKPQRMVILFFQENGHPVSSLWKFTTAPEIGICSWALPWFFGEVLCKGKLW